MAQHKTKSNNKKNKKLAQPFSSLASFLLHKVQNKTSTTMNEDNNKEEIQEEELNPQEETTSASEEAATEDTNAQESEAKEDAAENAAEEKPEEAEAESNAEKDPLDQALEKIAELNDKYLRKVAEFDNYRKRTIKEKSELILNGGEKTITKILPVIDDMERAIENGKKTDDIEAIREGIDLIYKKFIKILEGEGVERIETKDKDFNTDYHEAIAMVPGLGDDKKGKVVDCVQTGYTLNGKVIRYAKVAVGQ